MAGSKSSGSSTKSERKAKLRAICLALPQAKGEDLGDHASFQIGKKTFVYYLDNHHGDGIVGFCCKALPGENTRLIERNPRKFYMPAYVGPRGWLGLRLDRPTVDWGEVKELVVGSFLLVAPKRLAKIVQDSILN